MSDVDEWDRSERTRAVVRAIYEPIYSKWFRAEWRGLENVPALVALCSSPTMPEPSPPTRR